jgi:hypothetical protein
MTFNTWIDTLITEKNVSVSQTLEVEGASGVNFIPLSMVIDAIKNAPASEKAQIKTVLVKIDFANGDIVHFFKHLAGRLAI